MGKGDKKTRRGKITIGTYGVRRLRKKASKVKPRHVKEEKPVELKGRKSPREKAAVHEPKEVPEVIETAIKQPVAEVKEPKETNEVKSVKAPRKTTTEKDTKVKKQKDETKAQKTVKENKEEKETKSKQGKSA